MVGHKTSTRDRIFKIFVSVSIFVLLGVVVVSKKEIAKDATACGSVGLGGEISLNKKVGFFEGKEVQIPALADSGAAKTDVLGVNAGERWIEVDLSEQKLRAWEGTGVYLETLVATGLPWYATPTGEFRVWSKVRATKMEGGSGKYYYYLPNVPYVMFFENEKVAGGRGFSLHGTYWHNEFGKPRSHGCVNLPTSIAEQLYYWTTPVMPEGKSYVRSSPENPGTRIVIHE